MHWAAEKGSRGSTNSAPRRAEGALTISKNPMKDWKASVRTWEKGNKKVSDKPTNAYNNPAQNEFNDLERFYAN